MGLGWSGDNPVEPEYQHPIYRTSQRLYAHIIRINLILDQMGWKCQELRKRPKKSHVFSRLRILNKGKGMQKNQSNSKSQPNEQPNRTTTAQNRRQNPGRIPPVAKKEVRKLRIQEKHQHKF